MLEKTFLVLKIRCVFFILFLFCKEDNPYTINTLARGITGFDILGSQPRGLGSGVLLCRLIKSANSGGGIGYVPSLSLNKNLK
jgi:hypothetical protein